MEETEVIRSELLGRFSDLVFGFSTKIGGVSPPPLNLNLSFSVGDDPENVKTNRKIFFDKLRITDFFLTYQKQIHSSNVYYSEKPSFIDDCDAVFTDKKNNFLAVSTADCIPVFLYSPDKKVIAGIHAGWKGSKDLIVTKTINILIRNFEVDCKTLIAFIGPGVCQEHYEVGIEVAGLFDEEVKFPFGSKFKLNLKKENYNQLVKSGLEPENIEVSELCTYCSEKLFHSFRRDGTKAGRMLGVIGMI